MLDQARPGPFRRIRPRRHEPRRRGPGLVAALAQFTAAGLVAMLVLAAVGTVVLRRTGQAEALHQARVLTKVHEQAVRPFLTDALVAGDPAALEAFDRAVRTMVINDRVVRVKLWTGDGRVVYADNPLLIGQRFELGEDERQTLRTGRPASDLSTMHAPENRLDPPGHALLEVYHRTGTASGTPLLFETYLRYDSVLASSRRIWTNFAPALFITLLALELLQLPLAWRLTRRLQRGYLERETLQRKAIDASDAERRRIAADLHGGVVQTLAGVNYSLGAAAVDVRCPTVTPGAVATTISAAANLTRRSITDLRSLMVDIYPPNLREEGLGVALEYLLAPLPGEGLRSELVVPDRLTLTPDVRELLYRAAQEAIRNVLTHAQASLVMVTVTRRDAAVALAVRDDGCGVQLNPSLDDAPHFGLRLLSEMAANLNGRMHLESVPSRGTVLYLEVPLP